jgi:hypothetical protein
MLEVVRGRGSSKGNGKWKWAELVHRCKVSVFAGVLGINMQSVGARGVDVHSGIMLDVIA